MKKTDVDVIELMLRHSNDIQEAIKIFGDDIETFINNRVYQHAVIDCLLQIGELTTHLSDDFKNATSDRVNWVGLKVFRNIRCFSRRGCRGGFGSCPVGASSSGGQPLPGRTGADCKKAL